MQHQHLRFHLSANSVCQIYTLHALLLLHSQLPCSDITTHKFHLYTTKKSAKVLETNCGVRRILKNNSWISMCLQHKSVYILCSIGSQLYYLSYWQTMKVNISSKSESFQYILNYMYPNLLRIKEQLLYYVCINKFLTTYIHTNIFYAFF